MPMRRRALSGQSLVHQRPAQPVTLTWRNADTNADGLFHPAMHRHQIDIGTAGRLTASPSSSSTGSTGFGSSSVRYATGKGTSCTNIVLFLGVSKQYGQQPLRARLMDLLQPAPEDVEFVSAYMKVCQVRYLEKVRSVSLSRSTLTSLIFSTDPSQSPPSSPLTSTSPSPQPRPTSAVDAPLRLRFICLQRGNAERADYEPARPCRRRRPECVFRRQLPLLLAYGLTVHKAHGMTLPAVHVSLENTFAAGQAYVAVSRAPSLALSSFLPEAFFADRDVLAYWARFVQSSVI